jgi:hypothetical protein
MKFQSDTARQAAITEQNAQRARPFHAQPIRTKARSQSGCMDGSPIVSAFVNLLRQPAQQCFNRELRIRTRHGIAAQQETAQSAGGGKAADEAMQEEAAFTLGEHDLARPEVFERAARDLHHIARPNSRQHAFSVNAQMQMTAATQSLCRQS